MGARSTKKPAGALKQAETALRAHAMGKPHATEHFPWGERAIKVKGKVFLFMFADAETISLSIKLPSTGAVALLLPFAEPTGYGLGKAGWVSAKFDAGVEIPVDMLCEWIDESFRAVAPKKLFDEPTAKPPPKSKSKSRPKPAPRPKPSKR